MWTQQDPLLSKVLCYNWEGWADSTDNELNPYWMRCLELSDDDGCIMWEGRVVVPPLNWESVLIELHGGNPNTSWIKSLAWGPLWWPGMDQKIEIMVKPQLCYIPLCWPTQPWTWWHVDFAGLMKEKMFLIDAHLKWIEVFSIMQRPRQLFAQFAIIVCFMVQQSTVCCSQVSRISIDWLEFVIFEMHRISFHQID